MNIVFYKKAAALIALLFAVSLIFIIPVLAAGNVARVIDEADVLTSAEENTLISKLDEISERRQIDIAVITKERLGGKDAWGYANELYDLHGYAPDCVLLLISESDREFAFVTTGKAEKIFGSFDEIALEDAFIDYLHDDDYYSAFLAYAQKCDSIIKNDGKLSPVWIAVSLIVGAAVAAIVIWRMCASHKSVKAQKGADTYMLRNTFHVDRSRDVYLYSHVTRIPKPQSNSSSSRGGRSFGGSRGGRSGRF